jgi:predicted ester cyclase
MRKFSLLSSLACVGLVACGPDEPAAVPLAPPPPASVAPSPTPPPPELKKDEPKPRPLTAEQKVKAYQDGWAAFNAKDFGKFQEIWAENATSEMLDMGPPKMGAQAIADDARAFASSFPDVTGDLELTLVNGNTAVSVVLIRGTNKGAYTTPMGEVPATNKKVGFLAAHGIEFNEAGKAEKEWLAYDGATVAGQLGLMPMPHRKVIDAGWSDKAVVVASDSEEEKANLATFNTAVENFNKHDAASALQSAADELTFSELTAPVDRTSKKEAVKGMAEMFKAFPDVKLQLKSVWAAGDYVVATGSWGGTNTGDMPLAHLKKTGKPVSVQFVEIDKFAAGKTKNIWIFSNGAAVRKQLGLIAAKTGKPSVAKAEAGAPTAPKSAPSGKPPAPAKPPASASAKPGPGPAMK